MIAPAHTSHAAARHLRSHRTRFGVGSRISLAIGAKARIGPDKAATALAPVDAGAGRTTGWRRRWRSALLASLLWTMSGLPLTVTHAQVEALPSSANCATEGRFTPGYDRAEETLPSIAWCRDGDGPIRSIAVDGSTVYLATETGTVAALGRATGEQRWSQNPGEAAAALLATGGQLVSGNAAEIRAWSADGAERWTAPTPDRVVSLAAADTGAIIAALADGTVIALDPDTGTERWRTATAIPEGTLIAAGGTVYVYNTPRELNFAVLDAEAGSLRSAWILDTGPQTAFTSPVQVGTLLITGYDARPDTGWYGGIMAIDTVTGAVPWDIPVPSGVQIAPTLTTDADGSNPQIDAITVAGQVFRIDPGAGQFLNSPDIIESRGVAAGSDQLLAVAGQTYYVSQAAAAPANNVTYHNVVTASGAVGTADWRFRLGNPPTRPVIVDRAGVLIADGGSLFALSFAAAPVPATPAGA